MCAIAIGRIFRVLALTEPSVSAFFSREFLGRESRALVCTITKRLGRRTPTRAKPIILPLLEGHLGRRPSCNNRFITHNVIIIRIATRVKAPACNDRSIPRLTTPDSRTTNNQSINPDFTWNNTHSEISQILCAGACLPSEPSHTCKTQHLCQRGSAFSCLHALLKCRQSSSCINQRNYPRDDRKAHYKLERFDVRSERD